MVYWILEAKRPSCGMWRAFVFSYNPLPYLSLGLMPSSPRTLTLHGASFFVPFSWDWRLQLAGPGPCRFDVEGEGLEVTHPLPSPGCLPLGLAWYSVSTPDSWAGDWVVVLGRSPTFQMWSEPEGKPLPLKNLFWGDHSVFHTLLKTETPMWLHFPCLFPRA